MYRRTASKTLRQTQLRGAHARKGTWIEISGLRPCHSCNQNFVEKFCGGVLCEVLWRMEVPGMTLFCSLHIVSGRDTICMHSSVTRYVFLAGNHAGCTPAGSQTKKPSDVGDILAPKGAPLPPFGSSSVVVSVFPISMSSGKSQATGFGTTIPTLGKESKYRPACTKPLSGFWWQSECRL